MRILENKIDIENAMKKFASTFNSISTKSVNVVIGYQGGQIPAYVNWIASLNIWGYFDFPPDEKSPLERYWNIFGIGEPFGLVNIICEINPPFRGINRRAAGAFVKSDSGELYLVHRGNFNARGRIPKDFIRNNFRGKWEKVLDRDKDAEIILIGRLDAPDFLSKLKDFIHEAYKVKEQYRQR